MDIKYNYINCQNPDHKMAYLEWGNPHNSKVLICVHALTRNAKDFDFLAQVLAQDYRVICLDIVGRGKSDWLDEAALYGYNTYINDILTLLEYLKIDKVDWIGTSMGGLIGMFFYIKYPDMINNFIINDVGAFIPKEFLKRIAKYLLFGERNFTDFVEVLNYVKKIYASFGNLNEKQWKHLAESTVKSEENGGYSFQYDPKIAHFVGDFPNLKDIELWHIWELIKCRTLLIHGENSDLLLPETITKMQKIKPDLDVIHLPETGHAPSLMIPEQINLIKDWLLT